MPLPPDHDARLARARRSLEGLSVGDAFGEQFFVDPVLAMGRIETRTAPDRAGSWWWTDDTAMAISIVNVLAKLGSLDVDALAEAFTSRYRLEPDRGYGGGAHTLFTEVLSGTPWQVASAQLFDGMGSFGNGGAMRAAPIGAYFHDDLDRVVAEASSSAEPTHRHPEGRAGAIAIAVAAAVAQQIGEGARPRDGVALVEEVRRRTPRGHVREGIIKAQSLLHLDDPRSAAKVLGNGSAVSAQDTVPFCLWAIAPSPRRLRAGAVDDSHGAGRSRHHLRHRWRCRRAFGAGHPDELARRPRSRALSVARARRSRQRHRRQRGRERGAW